MSSAGYVEHRRYYFSDLSRTVCGGNPIHRDRLLALSFIHSVGIAKSRSHMQNRKARNVLKRRRFIHPRITEYINCLFRQIDNIIESLSLKVYIDICRNRLISQRPSFVFPFSCSSSSLSITFHPRQRHHLAHNCPRMVQFSID